MTRLAITVVVAALFSLEMSWAGELPTERFANRLFVCFPDGDTNCDILTRAGFGGELSGDVKTVECKRFWLATTEVTVAQFREFVAASDYETEPERGDAATTGIVCRTVERPEFTWSQPGFQQGDDHPVTCITYADARAYCRWLSKTHKRSFRLPTTAEWQYACLYGADGGYDFDPASNPEKHVNVMDASLAKAADKVAETQFDDGFVYTAPVKAKLSGRNGLWNMHGNVEEWCRNLEQLNE